MLYVHYFLIKLGKFMFYLAICIDMKHIFFTKAKSLFYINLNHFLFSCQQIVYGNTGHSLIQTQYAQIPRQLFDLHQSPAKQHRNTNIWRWKPLYWNICIDSDLPAATLRLWPERTEQTFMRQKPLWPLAPSVPRPNHQHKHTPQSSSHKSKVKEE